jgi:hypothetical protein
LVNSVMFFSLSSAMVISSPARRIEMGGYFQGDSG